MTEPMSIEKIAEELGVNFYDLHPLITVREDWLIERAKQEGRKEVVDYFFYDAGIVHLMGCRTMNEAKARLPNWYAKLKEWGI